MKKMSRSSRLVSMEASAPWCSIAGPDVVRMLTPISFAMMFASVVLPRPGGPAIMMCSIGSPPPLGCLDQDLQVRLDGILPDELAQMAGAKAAVELLVLGPFLARDDAIGHPRS